MASASIGRTEMDRISIAMTTRITLKLYFPSLVTNEVAAIIHLKKWYLIDDFDKRVEMATIET
jgi:hypothetical protein